jgi:hypothetical protein
MSTPDSADPRHYFRLLLQRLLETQQCLRPYCQKAPFLALQSQANESILLEIKSWLEEVGGDWEISPSRSSARPAASSGEGYFLPTESSPGGRPWPVVRPAHTAHRPGSPLAPSSQVSDSTRPDLVRTTTGRVFFLAKSSSGKPPVT